MFFFRALASPYRGAIIKLLKGKNLNVDKIADKFEISQSFISRHLDVLKWSKIVMSERKVNQIIYSLNFSFLEEMHIEITDLFGVNNKVKKENIV